MKFKEVVSVVRDLLAARTDVQSLSVTLDDDGVDFYYEGGPLTLEDRCIFDACSHQAVPSEAPSRSRKDFGACAVLY